MLATKSVCTAPNVGFWLKAKFQMEKPKLWMKKKMKWIFTYCWKGT